MTKTAYRLGGFWLAIVVLAVAVLAAAAAPAVARAAAQPPAGAQGDYVPLKDLPQQETLPAAPLVMAAYAFVWAVLLVYVWSVWRRLLKVEHEVKDLSARLAAKPGAKG